MSDFLVERIGEIKSLTWKAVFASLNPSPVFEVVAMLAERLATNGDESRSRNIDDAKDADTALNCIPRSWKEPNSENHSDARRGEWLPIYSRHREVRWCHLDVLSESFCR
jgi:hypothetical protein